MHCPGSQDQLQAKSTIEQSDNIQLDLDRQYMYNTNKPNKQKTTQIKAKNLQ